MASSSSSRERDQSRINVESIEEWNKIKQSFTEAMSTTLDKKLGAKSTKIERDAVLAHLMHWRDRTFDLAKENVRVNGIDLEKYQDEEEEEELEPYDEVLDRRLWTHFAEGLSWQSTLAKRRREEPLNAERLVEDLIMREINFELENSPPLVGLTPDPQETEAVLPERFTEVASIHQETVQMIEDWRESVTDLQEKVERVEAVAVVDSRLTP
ncbi:hypothetical protein FRB99_002311 [Tulasnella sp. 403]|nr:hypothetical protein FRB99_002311 [Tulasnella sp. 403]